MHSVGMRRITRVFGARVLRSGRRLWTEPRGGGIYTRTTNGENEWIKFLDDSADEGDADHRCKDVRKENENGDAMDIIVESGIEEPASEGVVESKNGDKMYGIVYKRKRKRAALTTTCLSEDKRFGKKFSRNQRWKKFTEPLEASRGIQGANDVFRKREYSCSAVGLPKSALRSMHLRHSRIQKRRSCRWRKRGKPAQKDSGALASDFFRVRYAGSQFSNTTPSSVRRSSDRRSSKPDVKELKSNEGAFTHDICASSCSSNLLIIETDKCYREEGAIISLEQSASKEWFLVIMKNGMKRYTLIAQNVMRPSSFNRFTHATVWAGVGSWKLEFPNKQDWLTFKKLYRECSERNVQACAANAIHIPGVHEVSSPFDSYCLPYVRPDSYITVKDDELTRALTKKGANYDMDSDDEQWLNEVNNNLFAVRELPELITPEKFELIIDALEKGIYCKLDEYSDEQGADDFCMHLERKEVITAIHRYWIKKRKQKHSALMRIFQLYQTRRTQVIEKSVLRKKRSFKQQTSQGGRGKQQTLVKAMAVEPDALERQNNFHKLQETKVAADRSEEFAILKRQRAQMLMENADLITYKASIALIIAEAAQVIEAPGSVAPFFLT